MRSASSKLQARTRIIELGLNAAQARKRPSGPHTHGFAGVGAALGDRALEHPGWRRSSERSFASRRVMTS